MHQHLVSKGLLDSAAVLKKEAHLGHTIVSSIQHTPAKFRYTTSTTPNRVKCSVNYETFLLNFYYFLGQINFVVTSNKKRIIKPIHIYTRSIKYSRNYAS